MTAVSSRSEIFTMKTNNVLHSNYPHVYRKKTICELIKLSAAVMGIEFAYSAETAFVSPILLELGMEHNKLIAMWAISPILGFMLAPVIGMWSDRCTLSFGRRRPFIIILSLGLLIGIILVPWGKSIGIYLGDNSTHIYNETNRTTYNENIIEDNSVPIYAIIFTIIGTVLMDLNADNCQSPIRAYLLEVTTPDDYARGLSMFTLTAGIGAFVGYSFGAIDWDSIVIGTWIGGNVKVIFLTVAIVLIFSVILTVTSFREIPLKAIWNDEESKRNKNESVIPDVLQNKNELVIKINQMNKNDKKTKSFKNYIKSVIIMPKSLLILYITHLLTWMSHLSYVLYFTDYVGERVFNGDPLALQGTPEFDLYNKGVRFGCWGLAIYALSCAAYSFAIEHLIKRFKTKLVYICGFLAYAVGMALLALIETPIAVLLSSITAGIAYSTLFNIPYLIIARYHTKRDKNDDDKALENLYTIRGVGTDMAIIGTTVFIAQLTLSLGLGAVTEAIGSISVTIWAAAILSALAAIGATQIIYLDI